jgi:hypothetical protein
MDVDHFLAAMRGTRTDEERRRYERMAGGDATATLSGSSHGPVSAKVLDISLGGAAFSCGWLCEVGSVIMVRLPDGGTEVASRVVFAGNNRVAVAFRQDPETLGHVTRALERIAAQARSSSRGLAA